MNVIEIWEPRWKDRVVLIAKYKVADLNKIIFTKATTYKGMVFLVDKKTITKSPIDTNGKVDCYAVPLDEVLDRRMIELEDKPVSTTVQMDF